MLSVHDWGGASAIEQPPDGLARYAAIPRNGTRNLIHGRGSASRGSQRKSGDMWGPWNRTAGGLRAPEMPVAGGRGHDLGTAGPARPADRKHFPKNDFHLVAAGSCTWTGGAGYPYHRAGGKADGWRGRVYRLQAFQFRAVCGVCSAPSASPQGRKGRRVLITSPGRHVATGPGLAACADYDEFERDGW